MLDPQCLVNTHYSLLNSIETDIASIQQISNNTVLYIQLYMNVLFDINTPAQRNMTSFLYILIY